MDAFTYRPTVTVADVLDVGACLDGVKNFITKHDGQIVVRAEDHPSESWIQKAADGYGYGDGDGDGDGDGS